MARPKRLLSLAFLWLLAGGFAVGLAWKVDGPVDAALAVTQSPSLHLFAWWCSKLGEGWVPGLAGISFAALFILLRKPGTAAEMFFVALTCEITGLAALILRTFIGRARPIADVPQGIYGVWYHGHWIIGKYEFASFPSGHSATAVGLAAAAWMVHKGWGAVATFYAILVMWSRIALQCHHLSDVVASIILSVPLAIMSKKVLLPPIESQFTNLAHSSQKLNSAPASVAGKI